MKTLTYSLLFLFVLDSCASDKNKTMENYKAEIIQVENDFAKMAKEEGVQKAFLYFAADNAVLNRNNTIIEGKAAIKEHFEKQTLKNVQLNWAPDFVEVALSGDIAYTYGHYTFSAINDNGEIVKDEGIFHTVWKKQADGRWKFVWD